MTWWKALARAQRGSMSEALLVVGLVGAVALVGFAAFGTGASNKATEHRQKIDQGLRVGGAPPAGSTPLAPPRPPP